jgi:hypothetical protein
MNIQWTHKVTKSQRGMNGKWFRHSCSFTFNDEHSAREFARQLIANQQAGVVGTRINVLSRRSFVGEHGFRTHNVAEYTVDR